MQSGMILIWIGVLLIAVGIVLAASQARKGRLSDMPRMDTAGASTASGSQGRAFHAKQHWLSIVWVALGIMLMLAEAAF